MHLHSFQARAHCGTRGERKRKRARPVRRPYSRTLRYEALEVRALLASFVVTHTGDSGAGSLRQAILDANAMPDVDQINFAIPANDARHVYYVDDNTAMPGQANGTVKMFNSNGTHALGTTTATDDNTIPNIDPDWPHSWYSIQLASVLPDVTATVVIDAYTQTGAAPNSNPISMRTNAVLRMELTAVIGTDFDGLRITGGGSTVRGFSIHGFGFFPPATEHGIELASAGNTVAGNHIGIDVSAVPTSNGIFTINEGSGVFVSGANNTIGGAAVEARNIIQRNRFDGVTVIGTGATGNSVQGSVISSHQNGAGVLIADGASSNVVGGDVPAAANVIGGNQQIGVRITGLGSANSTDNNRVEGNFIGTDPTGTDELPNNTNVLINFNAVNNVIGGLTSTPGTGRGNVIAKGDRGVFLVNATGTLIQGNLIGTNPGGTLPLGSFFDAVLDQGSQGTIIGGPDVQARNVISATLHRTGIALQTDGALVQNNFIGTDITGTMGLGNKGGVSVIGSGNTITGNVIAFNKLFDTGEGILLGNGVSIRDGVGNFISANSIFANDNLGIELAVDFTLDGMPLPNDMGDGDTGVNNGQNYPVLTRATATAADLSIEGTLNSTPNSSFRIEFFASTSADPSGSGEGQTFLDSIDVSTDASGNSDLFTFLRSGDFRDQFFTATATRLSSPTLQPTDTSEFSAAIVGKPDTGDAPDTGIGTGRGNYNTLLSDDGPSHVIMTGLRMGANVDGDTVAQPSATANGDDVNQSLPDDEDGLPYPLADLTLTIGAAPTVNVRVINTTASAATLFGWIDYNANGVFDNATERASMAVPSGTNNSVVTLTFPAVPAGFTGTTYARFRLSTDSAAANPTDAASDGEVEDYLVTITALSDGTANRAKNTKIAHQTNGGPSLVFNDAFGRSIASLGDLNGDRVTDLAVGANGDNTGGSFRGAVHVLFMNSNGTTQSFQKIASGSGNSPALVDFDLFGRSVASLGDLDGDGVTDLAVGATGDDTGGVGDSSRGAVYVLFMKADGTVKRSQKIASGLGGGPTLTDRDHFGTSLATLGDLDGDGIVDLAVAAYLDDTGAANGDRGAVYVLFLNADGTANAAKSKKIASGLGGGPTLANGDNFGRSVTALGDLDGDGITDLAVGAWGDDTGGYNRGAVHVLLMNSNGTVKNSGKIASGVVGGLTLPDRANFGRALAAPGDLNGDGVTDLVVGAFSVSSSRGAVHVLLLNANGNVLNSQTIASDSGGGPTGAENDDFGAAVAAIGDLDGDSITDLAVGAVRDGARGAVQILFLNPVRPDFGDAPDPAPGTAAGNYNTLPSDNGPSHTIVPGLRLGANADGDSLAQPSAIANGDDVNQAPRDDEDGLTSPLADLTLTVDTQPTVNVFVTNTTASAATLFGWVDYNADGVFDNATERASIAVPAGTSNAIVTLAFPAVPAGFAGATFARFRLSTDAAAANPTGAAMDGEVEDYPVTIMRPSDGTADRSKNRTMTTGAFSVFGSSLAALGDFDGDGVSDLVVGAKGDGTGGAFAGAVYVQLINADGTVKRSTQIAHLINNGPALTQNDQFGRGVASLGDLDGDGVTDLAVGALGDDTGGANGNRGAVHVLFLNPDGTAKRTVKIAHFLNGGPSLAANDYFGVSVASLGDLDGDGVSDLAVGAYGENGFGGAVHVLFMRPDGTVKLSSKINGASLGASGGFGSSVVALGDLDGDGVTELAVGAFGDSTGGPSFGAVHVLFLRSDGSVKGSAKIAHQLGGGPTFSTGDFFFGVSVSSRGDLDGNGVADLVAGARGAGPDGAGAAYVLFLKPDGTAKNFTKIAGNTGGGPALGPNTGFGESVALLGDLDGNGFTDLSVGDLFDNTVHLLFLNPLGLDFGDAPTAAQSGLANSYPTALSSNGARHGVGGPRLGLQLDTEADGQPNANAAGDDIVPLDDEDGVTSPLLLIPGTAAAVTVNLQQAATAKLDAWIDFNRDGDWDDAGEQVFASRDLVTGNNILSINVPAGALVGDAFARFRVSTAGGLLPTGLAADGEVEDYQVTLRANKADEIGVKRGNDFLEDVNGTGDWEGAADRISTFGNTTDLPLIGDWNGDGLDEIGARRGRMFYLDMNGNGVWNGPAGGDQLFAFGNIGDVPVVGDWDGDGTDEIGVQRGNAYYLDASGNGVWDGLAGGDLFFTFGNSGDTPVTGDWDGNVTDQLGVHRGNQFYLDMSGNGSWGAGDVAYAFGNPGDVPLKGNWDGSGADEIGIKRGSMFYLDVNGNGTWNGAAGDSVQDFGNPTDLPIIGRWQPLAPLMAAGGAAAGAAADALTMAELEPIRQQALLLWANTGLTTAQQQSLAAVQFRITDLPGTQLGLSQSGTILLDADAAGYGWFVDPTPADSSEFNPSLVPTFAQHSMDLLTAVLHELGHELGFDHDDDVTAMFETLAVGTRRLP